MTTETLIKKTFNWGGSLTVSEVQSIITMARNVVVCRLGAGEGAESISCRQQENGL